MLTPTCRPRKIRPNGPKEPGGLMISHVRTSMRSIRRLGVMALSVLVLSLAPPFVGVGSATESTAGSVAAGKPRDSAQLDQLQPWLGIRFKPDGASGQCGNAG